MRGCSVNARLRLILGVRLIVCLGPGVNLVRNAIACNTSSGIVRRGNGCVSGKTVLVGAVLTRVRRIAIVRRQFRPAQAT
jgi:hypothetical protein